MTDVKFEGGRLVSNVKLAFRAVGEYLYPQHIIVDSTGTEIGVGRSTDAAWDGQLSQATLVAIAKATHNATRQAIGAELDSVGNVFHPGRLQRTTTYDRSVADELTITTTVNGAPGTWVRTQVQTFSSGNLVEETDTGWVKQGV